VAQLTASFQPRPESRGKCAPQFSPASQASALARRSQNTAHDTHTQASALTPSALPFEKFHFDTQSHLSHLPTPSVSFPLLKR